jgi:O-antigen/teichoic acid export membrane protein
MSARRIAYSTLVQIAGKLIGFFVSAFLIVVLADRLGTRGIGDYTAVLAFVNLFVSVADMGINFVVIRDIVQRPAEKAKIAGRMLGFRFSFSLITLLAAPLVALGIPRYNQPQLVIGILIIALAQFILLWNQFYVSIMQSQLRMDRATATELINRVVTLVGTVILSRFSLTIDEFFFGALGMIFVGSVVNLIASMLWCRDFGPIKVVIDWQEFKKTFREVFPVGLFSLLSAIHFRMDSVLLRSIRGSYETGVYGYAYKIAEIIFTFPVMFMGNIFPKISELWKTDKQAFTRMLQKVLDVLLLATPPLLLAVYAFAPHLTVIIARNEYLDALLAGGVLRILIIAMFFWFISTLFTHALLVTNDYRGLIRNVAIAAVVNIVLNFFMISRYGFWGAAWVTVISEGLLIVLSYQFLLQYCTERLRFVELWKNLPILVVMGGILLGLRALPILEIEQFATLGRFGQLLLVGSAIAIGLAGFFALVLLLRKEVKGMLRGLLKRSA